MSTQRLPRVEELKADPRLKGTSWRFYEKKLKNNATATQYNMLFYFNQFLEHLDTDTEGLFDLYYTMTRDPDPRAVTEMDILISDFMEYLVNTQGLKWCTAKNALIALKGFFKANKLTFDPDIQIIDDSQEIPNISSEQFREILNASGSFRNKACYLLIRDTGLRVGDATALPIRVVRAVLDNPEKEYHTFEWKQEKTKKSKKIHKANPVLGPETSAALRKWDDYRVNTLKISAKDSDILFCTVISKTAHVDKNGRNVPGAKKGEKLSKASMGTLFRQDVKKAGLKPLPGGTKTPSIHSLRKYNWTQLLYAGVPQNWLEKMQGRTGLGTGGIYTKPNPEQLIEMFKRGYSELCGLPEDQTEELEGYKKALGESARKYQALLDERDKFREASRAENLVDMAEALGWPDEKIQELKKKLERDGVDVGKKHFRRLRDEMDREKRESACQPPELYEISEEAVRAFPAQDLILSDPPCIPQ